MESPHRRRWTNLLIAAVLVVHVLVPLRYYVLGTAPDERFCWRMFSTLQAELDSARTTVRVTEVVHRGEQTQQRVVSLEESLAGPWVRFLHLAYPPVIDKFLPWQRDRSGATEVRLVRTATLDDGTATRPVVRSDGPRPQD